jgi:hypothetical protein
MQLKILTLIFYWSWIIVTIKYVLLNMLFCRKGDYYRYLAEFKTGADRKEAADQSLEAYKVAPFLS